MAGEQVHKDIRVLIQLARIAVPEERLSAMASGFAALRQAAQVLASHPYGALEPACRFIPPGSGGAASTEEEESSWG